MVDAALHTGAEGLEAGDLPVALEGDTPEVLSGHPGEIRGANANQSQTTVFLLRLAREVFPDSRFVEAVERIERDTGIDFEDEILRQFDGPSASAVSPDGQTFAARSEVRDPDALAERLEELGPAIPELVDGLTGLQSEGMALLFLFAPDAPGVERLAQVQVEPPADADGLYHVTGVDGEGPDEFFYGLVDDVFVVASDEERALAVAGEDTEAVVGVEGTGVARGSIQDLERLPIPFGLPPNAFEEFTAAVDANTERLRATLRLEFE